MASVPTKVFIDPNSQSYSSMDEAANAVSKDFAQQSNEQAAVIIKKPDGSYAYSTVAPQGSDQFNIGAMLPKGHTLAGIVHSHPGNDDLAGYFSGDDLATAKTLGVPSYVRFDKDNSIRKYVPGVTKTQNVPTPGSKFGQKAAVGDALTLAPAPIPAASSSPPAYTPMTAQAASPGTATDSGVSRRDDSVTQY